ncbi:MAG: methyltransferase domain-containing protein [Neomegalonema sp.]|nr:methyltransferase domain-containing protein [Neomegalonema sp.]
MATQSNSESEPDSGSNSNVNASELSAPGVASRAVAAEILVGILTDGLFLDAAEARAATALDALSPRDRAFARRLTLAALRGLGDVDAALAQRLNHPPEDPGVHACLRIAAAELLLLKGPAHAAVDAAVRVAKTMAPRFSGLVNAVARRLAADAAAGGGGDPEQKTISTVDWAKRNTSSTFWGRLAADVGPRRAAAIIRAQADGAALDLTPKVPSDAESLAEKLGGRLTPTGSIRLAPSGPIEELPGFGEGEWWVQDAAAALPARLIGAQPGLRVADICAAPGGKTLQLAATGADVVAVDVSAARMERVRANLDRTGLNASCVAEDLRDWRPDQPFDAILLDAPCSASGTARRHPEAPYVKDLERLDRLARQQDELLDAAWRLLRPGGRLVYCVCSLFAFEGPERAESFFHRHANAEVERIGPEALAHRIEDIAACSELTTPQGALRTTPADWRMLGGLDGFYAARFRKRIDGMR